MMKPWFTATEPFSPKDGERWTQYIAWSGLSQLEEVASLDEMLCPSLLPKVKGEYWPHIVNENFMLRFFVNFDFLAREIESIEVKNVLCVFRDPSRQPEAPSFAEFDFLGYDLVDREGSTSALTNCGGFPDVFANSELSKTGLLTDFERAVEVQKTLRLAHPEEHHADCHLWAVFRLAN
jgi:hypothetical protein